MTLRTTRQVTLSCDLLDQNERGASCRSRILEGHVEKPSRALAEHLERAISEHLRQFPDAKSATVDWSVRGVWAEVLGNYSLNIQLPNRVEVVPLTLPDQEDSHAGA